MYSVKRNFFIACLTILLGSCGDGDSDLYDYSDFRSTVKDSLSVEARDCGDYELDENLTSANCCIASQATVPEAFFVTFSFDGQGLAVAYALDSSGNATVFSYTETFLPDSSGGLNRSVSVSRASCAVWSINSNACSQSTGAAFTCQDLGEFDEIINDD